jgi:hypothetical protein
MFMIALVSIFGNRSIETDIKNIGVTGIEEIVQKDFKTKAFYTYYNSVN